MTTSKASGRTSSKGGAAARAEKAPQERKLKFAGIDLVLPAELPPELLFDLVEIEAADENPMPVMRMLRSLLGADQFTTVRNRIAADEKAVDIAALIEAVFGVYGVTPGEAPASPDS